MASIDKVTTGWRARWRTPDGKSRSRTFARKIDAQRHLTSVEHSKLSAAYVDPAAGRTTFREYAEAWRHVQAHRHGTQTSVEQHLRLHVYPLLGTRPLGAVRPSEIQALVRSLSETLAPSTLAVVYGRVVAVFRAAVRDRVIVSSPCVDVRLPARCAVSSVSEVLTPQEVRLLAGAVPTRYRALIMAGAGLGLRPGELFGLTVDHVEFLRRQIRVDEQLVRTRGAGVVLGPLKTPSSYRTVPLPETVGRCIADHLATFGPHGELGLVFTNERSAPIQLYPFSTMFSGACLRAGLPAWATPHDLRHFYASSLIRSGASVKVIQARLGHSSAKTTLDVYGHLFPDEEDRTRQAMDDVLGHESTNAAHDDDAGQPPTGETRT